jgi:Photosynthesis system II assembly factor YCF48
VHGSPETLYAIVEGAIWASVDGARTWARRGGIFPASVDALDVDSKQPTRLWAAGGDRLFSSDDGGASWERVGRTLPEPNTTVRGIAASEEVIVVTTDRGLYRTVDGGESWTMIVENLPAHLEAGPLVRDPGDSATLYAGFALVPYPEIWRRAAEREGALARVSVTSLAGGGIFLVVVALGALAALRWFGRFYRPSARGVLATRPPPDHRMEKTLR